jgi:hypothetical protein
MTPHQILIVAIRLVAILWFFHAVGHTASILSFVPSARFDESSLPLVWWSLALFELIACAFLWLFPATIARRLLPGRDAPASAPAPVLLEWQTMAVIVIGIWALSQALPDAIYWVTFFGLSYSDGRSLAYLTAGNEADLMALIAKIVVALWLVFGAKGFAAFLFRVRTAGLKS